MGANYSKRKYVILAAFIFVGLVFIVNLFRLQVLDPTYKRFATNNILREVVQYPARGLIFDRNSKLLVFNKTAYDLLVTPNDVKQFDTLLLCSLLEISKLEFLKRFEEAVEYSRYRPSILVKQISPESFAILQEQLFKFSGFHTQARTLREYSHNTASHVLGYVGEVNQNDLARDNFYRTGDYIGINGIEKAYEMQLRGEKGVKKYLVDVHNRVQGSFRDGGEDRPAQIGKNLTSTIDVDLQMYAERLFQNKKGGMVAIEPATGEILAMISAPYYNPGLLVGRIRSENYLQLAADTLKPLFNRALLAEYPPASTFKIANALIALQEQVISESTRYSCDGPESWPIKCTHYHGSPVGVVSAIRESCNPFMWNTFRALFRKFESSEEGYNAWRDYVLSFGVGRKLGADFSNEGEGSLPETSYFDGIYGRGHWNSLTVRSLSIGQGELGVTPLQMANYCAVIANRGFYYIPHVVKEVEGEPLNPKFQTKNYADISSGYFDIVIEGMEKSVQYGAPGQNGVVQGISVCGKTGSAQNPHGSAHSVFMAFAPKDEPKIALALYVEHGVWGSRYAAPMASLIIEKYLKGSIPFRRNWREKQLMEANLYDPNQPELLNYNQPEENGETE